MTMLGLSDLQFALAVIGLLIVILVAVLNFKYARARRKARIAGEYSLDDRFGREPSFGSGFAETEERPEPTFGDAGFTTTSTPDSFSIDPRIDCVITLRYAQLVAKMSDKTQFLFISHNKITMEIAHQLIGVTMQEQGVSRIVAVDISSAVSMVEAA